MSEIEFTEADQKILVKVYVSLDRIVKEERAIADAFNDLSGDVYELERRIAKLENDQMLTMQTSPVKMPLQFAIAHLEGMAHVAQRRVRELDALEQRIEKLERKLGVDE